MDESNPRSESWGPRLRLARGVEPRTQAGKTAQRLRRDIIRNTLKPGERLPFDQTRQAYGVGVSPLREALFQLAAQGLVVPEGHKGFMVAPISLGEMLDVSSMRAMLESRAIRHSIEQGDEEWEIGVVTAYHRLHKASTHLEAVGTDAAERAQAEDDWELRHREFHFALCSACGSPWLLHFFEELYDQLERYRRHYWRYPQRVTIADAEHEAIMKAAIERQAEKAASLLDAHFRNQAEVTLAMEDETVPVPDLAMGA
ncbi:GntR family transcriptional regulator [Cucumibacter marinus]|uniref:GntR family transcriptional regulator n=1 Tax=Cucumibacter marinus TaxID=1121252 RepID=UPI0004035F72|nr:FCD domain-containing protein [Cucumibacter marinus]